MATTVSKVAIFNQLTVCHERPLKYRDNEGLKTDDSLMLDECIADQESILQYF